MRQLRPTAREGQRLTRRRLLKVAGASFAATLASSRTTWAQPGARISLCWWQEPGIGLDAWMQDTIARFQNDTGISIDERLLDINEVPSVLNPPPDVQFLWNGTYHMENVWGGYLSPLDGLVSRSVLQRSGATTLSVFAGRQYRVGLYSYGSGLAYNKRLFDQVGLDANDPPRTWSAFLDACERLKAHAIVPFGGGAKDGYFGDWYLTNTLIQNLDSPAEAISLFIGDLDWRESRFHEHWVRLEELHKHAFLNEDIAALDHFDGLRLFDGGRMAMCLFTTPFLPRAIAAVGAGNVGFIPMPAFGTGTMAGIPILDTHGLGIPTRAPNQFNAARFIEYVHTSERVRAMWDLSGQIPSDESFDARAIQDPFLREVYVSWIVGPHVPYIGNLMPTEFWNDVMRTVSSEILSGQMTGDEAGDRAADHARRWRADHAGLLNSYARWGRELSR